MMRKVNVWMGAAVIMLLLCLTASCSKKSEYMNALPQDAKVVMAIDGKAIAKKANLDGENGKKLQDKLVQLLCGDMAGEDYKQLESAIRNPGDLGFSLSDKIFFFTTDKSKNVGLVFKVADEKKLSNMFDVLAHQIGHEVTTQSGCSFLDIEDAVLGTNGSAMLLVSKLPQGNKATVEYMVKLLEQKEEGSYAKGENFSKMLSQKGEITAVGSLAVVPEPYSSQIRLALPDDADLSEIFAVAGLSFEKGKIVLESDIFIANENLRKQIKNSQKAFGKMNGRFVKCIPQGTPLFLSASLNGPEALKILGKDSNLAAMFEEFGIDPEQFLGSVNGDVAVAVKNVSLAGRVEFALMAEARNKEAINDLKDMFSLTGKLKTTGKDEYAYPMLENGGMGYFGYKNGFIYMTSEADMASKIGETVNNNMTDAPWAGRMKNDSFFIVLDADALMKSASVRSMLSLSPALAQGAMALQDISYMDMIIQDDGHISQEIVIKDTSVNVLERLVTMLLRL